MTDSQRRTFLKHTAVAAALGTPALSAASRAAEAATRSGLIDCQSHLFCEDMLAMMARRSSDPVAFVKDGVRMVRMGDWLRKVPPHYLDVDTKLAAMDAAGVERAALSINDPGPEWFGADGPAVARMANDFVAGVVARHPHRFFGLCVLPLQDMQASLVELDRCVNDLGMKGVLLYTNLAGRFPDEPEFRPLFARAEKLGLPLLLHPAKPVTIEQVKAYEMTSALGNMFDNTIALTRIIMSGILDEFPDLKLVCPHLGGALPFLIGRVDHQTQVLKRGPKNLRHAPSEYLRRVWFDIVSPLPLAMKFAYDFLGPDRLLFASDHPWVEPKLIRDTFEAVEMPADDRQKIASLNARTLFRL
jgi:predicted TIM-barrel fold metal-dependent hydrolase